jgi:hypothetical protein
LKSNSTLEKTLHSSILIITERKEYSSNAKEFNTIYAKNDLAEQKFRFGRIEREGHTHLQRLC